MPLNTAGEHPPIIHRGLLTSSQVARILHVSLRTAQRYIADGKLPAARLPGGHWRIRAEDVHL
jgi:excisionase family DNA binding protein